MMKRIAEETIVKEKHRHLNQRIAISELKIVTEGFITIVSWAAQFICICLAEEAPMSQEIIIVNLTIAYFIVIAIVVLITLMVIVIIQYLSHC